MNFTDATILTNYDNNTYRYTLINASILTDVEKISQWIFLGFLVLGIPLNVIVFFSWLIGPKSKTLCCATYFAANAAADLLCLTIPGISTYLWTIYYDLDSVAFLINKYTK